MCKSCRCSSVWTRVNLTASQHIPLNMQRTPDAENPTSPYEASATPEAMTIMLANDEILKTSVAKRHPTTNTRTGKFAFSICMKDTVMYRNAILPKNRAEADNAPTGRQNFAHIFQLSCCLEIMPDLTASAPTRAETAMWQQVRITGKGKRFGCINHSFDNMTPLLRHRKQSPEIRVPNCIVNELHKPRLML